MGRMEWKTLEPDFRPHRWLQSGHWQTVAAASRWRRSSYAAQPHRVGLEDGDALVVHEDRPASWSEGGQVALLVPGLTGCHASAYLVRLANKLCAGGTRVFRVDPRGFGAGLTLARHSMHAGRTGDLLAVLRYLENLCPGAPRSVVGFSLGGSVVLRMLGELAGEGPRIVQRAIAVAAPLDLLTGCRQLGQGVQRWYDRYFARQLWRYWQERRRRCSGLHDRPVRQAPRSLYEFDAQLTAPLAGFTSVEEYYTSCSSLPLLDRIEVPTRVLVACDDPVVAVEAYERARFSSVTECYATQGGGHLGYLAERSAPHADSDWYWMDWRLLEWLNDRE